MPSAELPRHRRPGLEATRYCFVFPGQGSQRVGMGADVLRHSPRLRELLARGAQLTGHDVCATMLEGPEERLNDTIVTQVAIFSLSVALTELLASEGVRPALVAGHSLGEYAALVAAGCLDADVALDAVAARAAAMAASCAAHEGAMCAVVGLAPEFVDELCSDAAGVVVLANHNSSRQTVVAGEPAAVDGVAHAARAAGASGVVALPVSGAFHSPFMAAAEQRLAPIVAQLPLRAGHVPFVSSITGELVDDIESYRRSLAHQITGPVHWDRAMRTMSARGIETFVEVGPGRALRGLLRQFDREIVSFGCDSRTECSDLSARKAA